MNVFVRVLFDPVTEDDWFSMRSLALGLTEEPEGIRVYADSKPDWLVVEFTIKKMRVMDAVDRVDRGIRYHLWRRQDSVIEFPLTEAERQRAERKNAQRRARRAANRKKES
jgi:hypothetical protein